MYGSFTQTIAQTKYIPISSSFFYLKFTYKQKISQNIKYPLSMHNQFNKNCKLFKKTLFKQMKERRNGYKLKASVICKTVTYQRKIYC